MPAAASIALASGGNYGILILDVTDPGVPTCGPEKLVHAQNRNVGEHENRIF